MNLQVSVCAVEKGSSLGSVIMQGICGDHVAHPAVLE